MPTRPKGKPKTNLRQTAFTRFTLVVALLVLWMGCISVRLVHLQVNQHSWLKERATGQRQDIKRSKSPRGTIYDHNELVLAMSVKVKTLYADATKIDDVKAAAKTIAKVLNIKETTVASQLGAAKKDEKRFLPLIKGLDDETVQKINKALEDPSVKKADLPRFTGLYWREDQKRSYPYQTLAAHLVGFSNAEGIGQAGIEQSQNDILFGAVIKKLQERDRLGRVYDETVSEKEPPKDIVLTISTSMQYHAEQALEKAVKASAAKSGMAVAIDHKTGEILALANYPTFDPNKLNEISADNLTNNVIQSVYSPGSVFKLVTYGSALEKKLITPDAEIDSGNGTIEVAKHRFKDSHPIGKVTYSKALAHSSNVCAIKTSLSVGKEDFYSTVKKLGFGRPTGVELPAETGGIVRRPEKWNGDSLASMSIGYEIGVSALQMATAFATIANDGVRIQPHIIKEIRQLNEQSVPAAQPEKTQVVSTETARDLQKMLQQVVLAGTGKMARLNGYTSAGKTGTAWKFDEKLKRVNSAKYISSFIGFAPAQNPAVTIAVVIDEPTVGGRNGGQVAAPAFREIAEQILPELGLKPEGVIELEESTEVIAESVGSGATPIVHQDPITVERKTQTPNASDSKTPVKKDSKTESALTKADKVKNPSKSKVPAKEVKAKTNSAEKHTAEATPKGQIKNKSSTEKKKEKT
ncbi:MAG: peptidoglycan D,D-transpeptidase FtsI family protein [Pyrinomonadaceae bacterium]